MTTEHGGEAAVTETATTTATQAVVSSQEPAERDFEAEARDQGWVPETEFKGDKKPKKFLSAEEFVERGEWADTIREKVEAKYDDRFKKLERVHGKTVEQLQRQHEKEVAALTAERRAAIKEGNVEEVERIDGAIEDLKEAAPESKQQAAKAYDDYPDDYAPEKDSPEHTAMTLAFVRANPWMVDEPEMAEFAEKVSERHANANPNEGFKANAKATEAAVRRKFPNYFAGKPETAANGHAAVDGGGQFSGGPIKTDKLASLPAEARQQAKSDMAKFPKIYPSAEAWLKVYNG